jgi:S-(hydroxymethyl)glutathione dehydrogenase / alcohol dehydrogenase
MTALSPIVLAWLNTALPCTPRRRAPWTTAVAGSLASLGNLVTSMRPSRTATTSVNVAPTSTPARSDEHLSLLGCGVTAGVGAVLNLAEVQAGSSVAVVGCGALGLWMIQGARVAGATTIVAVEPRGERRELARAVGATHALDPADGDPVAAVKALTGGRGADYALEAAGPPEAMAQALAMTRPAGTMVPAGWETLSSTVTLPAVDFAVGGKRIQSCQYGGAHIRRDVPRFAGMLEAGLLDAVPLVSRRFALEEVNEALAAASRRELITAVIVPDSPS